MKKLAFALLLAATPALAQAPKPAPATVEMETVYSDAMLERDQTLSRRLVESMLKPPITMENQYARWTVPVCPHVYGLAPGPTYVVERRIRDVARQVGAQVDKEDCRYNISIIVTPEPQATLDSIAKAAPFLIMGAPRKELKIRYPVQAWYTNLIKDYGGVIHPDIPWEDYYTDQDPPRFQANVSRLRTGVQVYMGAITILVDNKAIMGMSLGTLGDYVALLSLAQARPNGICQPAPTIANLMMAGCPAEDHVTSLSEVDIALLTGLYSTPLEPEMIQKPRIIGNMRKMLEAEFNSRN
jgi:hypothetical protein